MADNDPQSIEHDVFTDAENYLRTKISQDNWLFKSGTQLLAELRSLGFKIRDTDFFNIRRDILNIATHQQQIEGLKAQTPIPLAYMDRVPTWKLSADFQYQLKYGYTLGDDLTQKEQFFTLSSSEQLSKETVEELTRRELEKIRYTDGDFERIIGEIKLQHVYTLREAMI